jgi:hypothetical protein
MFRMPRISFASLFDNIRSKVGKDVFKAHEYLVSRESRPTTDAASGALDGILSGEMKVAMMLRIMARAS